VLVRQRAANRFLVYKYGTQRIYSGQVTDNTWRLALVQLAATPGHLTSLCGLTTDPSSEFLVVKHQGKIVFSLAWETYRLDRLPIGQEARLAPALALMRRFRF
jgi:6-phosphogluconolactonase (cycloisomerase 2 family)